MSGDLNEATGELVAYQLNRERRTPTTFDAHGNWATEPMTVELRVQHPHGYISPGGPVFVLTAAELEALRQCVNEALEALEDAGWGLDPGRPTIITERPNDIGDVGDVERP